MPKTHNNLYEQIIDFDNLWAAYVDAKRGKDLAPEVLKFNENLEENLINIHNHLVHGTWRPGRAYRFRLYGDKQRDIEAPPFEDRIVHHALVRIVEPLFERRFIYHSYACRKQKGPPAAVLAVQKMIRRAERNYPDPYVIKADISKYFPSITHITLFDAIQRVVSCRPTLRLWAQITHAYGYTKGWGVPIGALPSQLVGNIMMDYIDHAITDHAGVGDYVRYMDDFIIIAPNKRAAGAIMVAVEDEIDYIRLRLNPKSCLFPAARGVDFAGYRIWSTHILPRKRNIKNARKRFKKMAKQYANGEIDMNYVQPRVASFLAYTKHCNARDTVDGVLGDFVLERS